MICRAIPFDGSEPFIFLSYCHRDKEALFPLFEQMALDGYRMWYDEGNCAGDDWLDNIENHLEDCRVVVAFISDNSSLSHNCKSEIVYALKCRKKIIPVLIDSADLPKGLRMQLSHLHYLKNSDFPSNAALLQRIYEAEECGECRAPAGSILLRDAAEDPGEAAVSGDAGSFWEGYTPVKPPRKRKPEKAPEEKAPEKEAPAKKPRRVRISAVVRKKPASGAEEASLQVSVKTDPPVQPADQTVPPVRPEPPADTPVVDTPRDEVPIRSFSQADTVLTSFGRNLALLLHPAADRAYILRKSLVRVGRSPIKCDIAIEGNGSVSKYHADILQQDGRWLLRDMNSANGTFIGDDRLTPGVPVALDNPTVVHLNDEPVIFLSGDAARTLINRKTVSLLMTHGCTAFRLVDSEILPLNRSHQWPDGTLSDPRVHRAAHAFLRREVDGIHLIDESPAGGNGTQLNGVLLSHGESRLLRSGDSICLGDTMLQFVSITI